MHSPLSWNQRRFRCVNQSVDWKRKEDLHEGMPDIRDTVMFLSVALSAGQLFGSDCEVGAGRPGPVSVLTGQRGFRPAIM